MKAWKIGAIVGWIWGLIGVFILTSTPHTGILIVIGVYGCYIPFFFAQGLQSLLNLLVPGIVATNDYIVWITVPLHGAAIVAAVGYILDRVSLRDPADRDQTG